jgi:AraC-like DNA-binding protein
LGSADFAASLAGHLRLAGREVPKTQRSLARPTLAALRGAGDGKDRAWMREAQRRHGYTQSQIAAEAGLHYSTVSRLIKALEAGPAKRKT